MNRMIKILLLITALLMTPASKCNAADLQPQKETASTDFQEIARDAGFITRIVQNTRTGYSIVVEDGASLLSGEEIDELVQVMGGITEYGNVAFISTNTNYSTADDYARDRYKKYFQTGSGTLFLIDMDNRKIWIHSDGAVYKAITKSYANTITDNVYTYATNQEYYKCAAEAFAQINKVLVGQRIAQPMKYISNALLALILAMLFNYGLVCYFTKVRKTKENELLKSVRRRFTCTKPVATLVNQTKTYSPQSSDSDSGSGGGGSSSGGGGSSSGGGGGHSF